MLNANNEINIKKEERKYSWSTVFTWLYLKTIGRILPKRWNRWAENILYYDKATANNEVQTDRVTFQDMTIQTEYVEKANKNIEVDLKPEIAEKESQSEIMSKDGGVQTDGVAFQDTGMQTECVEKIDKSVEVNLKSEVAEKESQRKLKDENEKLKGELEGANQVLKAFIGLYDDQAQQIANLQTGNDLLEEENGKLKSKLAELEKSYRELTEIVDKRGKELLAKLKERSKTIVRLGGELIKLSAEFANKTRKLSLEGEEKDAKINSLTLLNEALEQDKKAMQNKVDEQQQTISEFKSLTDKNEAVEKDNESLRMQIMRLEGKVSELESRLSTAINKKKNLENDVAELQKQVQTLEGNKEWELAGIDGTLKETSLTIMELLAQQLLLNNQEQSVKEKKLEELTLSYGDQVHQIAGLQTENLSLEVKNRKLLSVIERSITEEAEVKKMDKQVWQNQHKLIDQIKKLEEALKEKDAQYKEQLNENQHALGNLEYKLESLESQSTTAKMQQRKNSSHQINTKSITKSEADLPHEKKASFVKKRKNNLYNEKFVQSYTNSLSEDALEKSIKTKAKPLGSSNVQKLAKNISNKFMSPKNTNSTPNSFMSHTNNTAHVLSLSNVRAGS